MKSNPKNKKSVQTSLATAEHSKPQLNGHDNNICLQCGKSNPKAHVKLGLQRPKTYEMPLKYAEVIAYMALQYPNGVTQHDLGFTTRQMQHYIRILRHRYNLHIKTHPKRPSNGNITTYVLHTPIESGRPVMWENLA